MAHIPSLNWLRVFEAAARTGSFARAAETLNMSAPAVSQQIKALEGALGRDLFQRGPRSVQLTDAGAAYLPTVSQALHSVELVTGTLFGDPAHESLTLRCSVMMAAGWLIPRLPRFRDRHPEILLSLTSEIQTNANFTETPDLRISFGLPEMLQGETDPLFGERIFPVAKPEIAQNLRSRADLAQYTLIEISTHRANWSDLLTPDGPDPVLLYCDTTLNAFAMAASGIGLALARAPASDALVTQFGLERCMPDLEISGTQRYMLSYPARSGLTRAAKAFRTWLLEEVEHDR
ncbi:MAG: LysR family transcriptional regulator [Pseudomonadota bacterium]